MTADRYFVTAADGTTELREVPLPGLLLEVVQAIDEDKDYTEAPYREYTRDVANATVATSKVVPVEGSEENLHKVVLDIDIPAKLVPSSTPGHSHLYIDKAMPWGDYFELLSVLADVGLIERGYFDASIARGHTAARLPWVKKGEPKHRGELEDFPL
ncbi:hypothetical protein [Microbacterium sp.]|uniref:hypothetical protein n=1 Tax=Microbacterium sp. TaxID=51671 RepID=UPI003241CA22